ncbi:class I glutamine amidotransferase-like protein [Massarina eburnea CBS 473.64]|uniref:Class I glutamine amidotransferase-like protein n=1 Tax=Massarina eburnea CBS 473.64 TaxID=1395130 RepID=A0A6A6RKR1_9PLEO|nr:class I glutamine amidotransferase-like protein [Massarina eburnea CBS 473.64]
MSTPRGYTTFPSSADLFYLCTTSSTSKEDLNLHYVPPSKSSLKIGVLVLGKDQVQLLDLAVVDMLAKIGRGRISTLNAPSSTLDEAVDELDIRYVSETGEGSFAITSGARMPVTNSFANAPPFDILIIPGSFTASELAASASSFLATQYSNPDMVAVICIASGILDLAQTGLLRQKRATGPSFLLSTLQQQFPETTWLSMPWTRHDRLWSSASAISALDMVAAWMREYFWDRREAIECALAAAGIAPLDDDE